MNNASVLYGGRILFYGEQQNMRFLLNTIESYLMTKRLLPGMGAGGRVMTVLPSSG